MFTQFVNLLAQSEGYDPSNGYFVRYIVAIVALLVAVVFGLWKDLPRFSITRTWAVSNVSFTEAIRKRVLWVTPLAIVAVIVVSQFQKPVDELDAIRQTTKFCLFATGMLVTLTAILLACTNLPKEIENRVIFTIVTKPTTRLEIIMGKVIGFARVSAAILLIMGVFTYSYLHLRSWTMQREIKQRLANDDGVEPGIRPTLEYYADGGLLSAKQFFTPVDLNFYSRIPQSDDAVKWTSGASEQSIAVPFEIPSDMLPADPEEAKQHPPLRLGFLIEVRRTSESATEDATAVPTTTPATRPVRIPYLPGMEPDAPPDARQPSIVVEIYDRDFFTIVTPQEINSGRPVDVQLGDRQLVVLDLPTAILPTLRKLAAPDRPARFHVNIRGAVPGYEYGVASDGIALGFANPNDPMGFSVPIPPAPAKADAQVAIFRGRPGTHGQQLRGDKPDVAPVAVYRFRNQQIDSTEGNVPVELRAYLERSGVDDADAEKLTDLHVEVVNRTDNTRSVPILLHPENGRTIYANLPAKAMAGGNFDLVFTVTSPGSWLTFTMNNLGLVQADRSFGLNLLKSLLILWLLTILVVTIAVFCSTFLSWPIAVVLTVLILLGHWGVVQLGDALTPGIGRQIVNDFRVQDAAQSEVLSRSVESLARALQAISSVLPDINQFAVTEDIERGVWIPGFAIYNALFVLVMFGLPLMLSAYVIFRYKEVAP